MSVKLAAEMPHSCLETFGEMFDYEFCLTHLAEQNEKYFDFYKKQNARGRFSILDNSVFELGKAVELERILKIWEQFENPENVVIVAPDAFNDGEKTKQQFETFYKETSAGIHFTTMAVAQGKTWEEWADCYRYLSEHSGVDIIGTTYDIEFDVPCYYASRVDISDTRKKMWRRIFLFQKLKDLGWLVDKEHHLLGSSDPYELYFQSTVPQITTMDTSIPFVEGLQLHAFDKNSFKNFNKLKRPADYFDLNPSEQHFQNCFSLNIFRMKMWAQGRDF